MKLLRPIIFSLIALVSLASCQKDIDYFIPDPGTGNGPDTAWYNTVSATMPVNALRTALLFQTNIDSIDASGLLNFSTGSGLQLSVSPASLLVGGVPVTGIVTAQTLLLTRKGQMIRMGVQTTSNGALVLSNAALFVELQKNGLPLQLTQSGSISIKYPITNTAGVNLQLFNGVESQPFNWLRNYDSINNRVSLSGNNYSITSNRLRWLNTANVYDTAGNAQTNLTVKLPANYTNANTMVWVAINDMPSVVELRSDVTARNFTSGRLPAGRAVSIVVMSKQVNDFYLGTAQVSTAAAGTINTIVNITPVISSIDQLRAYLNTL